jgi:hypothetical protein
VGFTGGGAVWVGGGSGAGWRREREQVHTFYVVQCPMRWDIHLFFFSSACLLVRGVLGCFGLLWGDTVGRLEAVPGA